MGATIGRLAGKAPSDRPALKPYWGKPAVRNFRGGDGDVGIIRSPVRAIALSTIAGTGAWLRRAIGLALAAKRKRAATPE